MFDSPPKSFKSLVFVLLVALVKGVSPDCQDVLSLATGLNMHLTSPSTFTQLSNDCCSTTQTGNYYTKCTYVNSIQRVELIQWSYMGLNGTFNATAFSRLNTLYDVDFRSNAITGSPPPISSIIQKFVVRSNKLSGPFPEIPNQAANMYLFDLAGNQFYGCVPITFPQYTKYVYLYDNQFTGNLTITRPFEVKIANNYFVNVKIVDSSSMYYNANRCDVSNNPLGIFAVTQPVPSWYLKCNHANVYNATQQQTSEMCAYRPSVATTTLKEVSFMETKAVDDKNEGNAHETNPPALSPISTATYSSKVIVNAGVNVTGATNIKNVVATQTQGLTPTGHFQLI
eukprot:NODE_732_length_4354_cov_0.742656.p1 type:complete len:341 gc:universal NODE_732_length_4354_cov_0.742656:1846-824(-)